MSKPDYIYDIGSWEVTMEFSSRDDLMDGYDYGDIAEMQTLVLGPKMFAVELAVTFDECGDPDGTEIRWFSSREEAEAAVQASKQAATANV